MCPAVRVIGLVDTTRGRGSLASMSDEPKRRLTLQDLLAGITCIGIAAGLLRVATLYVLAIPPSHGNSPYPPDAWRWLALASLLLVPAPMGAAIGCFAHGWRHGCRIALWIGVLALLSFGLLTMSLMSDP